MNSPRKLSESPWATRARRLIIDYGDNLCVLEGVLERLQISSAPHQVACP